MVRRDRIAVQLEFLQVLVVLQALGELGRGFTL
jgi:hypothetical protein